MMNIAAVLLLQLLLRMELLYSGAVSIDPELLSMPFLEHFAFEYYITNCMGRASVLYRSQNICLCCCLVSTCIYNREYRGQKVVKDTTINVKSRGWLVTNSYQPTSQAKLHKFTSGLDVAVKN